MIKLGIDIGSRNVKIVLYEPNTRRILFSGYQSTELAAVQSVNKLLEIALTRLELNLASLSAIGVTGYGRKLYQYATSVHSEITCHGEGCRFHFPYVKTIIDIGGQDAKVITLDANGKVADFVMNDKCAAGTGRFLELTSMLLGCEVGQLSALAAKADKELKLNSTCVVFAESEIIGNLAAETSAANIARAVHNSVAKRIVQQMVALNWCSPTMFTGGVALNTDLAYCLGTQLECEVLTPPDPEITGALGAAILARIK